MSSSFASPPKCGSTMFVCGQALAGKGYKKPEVAYAALTVVINRQADGHSCILVP